MQVSHCAIFLWRPSHKTQPFGLFTSKCSIRVQHCRQVLQNKAVSGLRVHGRKSRRVGDSALSSFGCRGGHGGCASTDTGAAEVWDPLEAPNRFIFSLNRAVDIIALRPLAVLYRDWMPEPAQKGVRNVLDNLGEPVTALNEVVQ